MRTLGPALALFLAAGASLSVALAAEDDPAAQIQQAVEAALRHRSPTPSAVRLRRVEVYRQSAPNTLAACGQVSPTGADDAFIDFAAVAITKEGEGVQVQELYLADGGPDAGRTRTQSWLRCTDDARRLEVTRPGSPARASAPPAAPTGSPPGPQASPTGSTVTIRQRGNLRTGPGSSHSVIRTIPSGTVVRVFGHEAGGWYLIGDTAPWGWMHESRLAPQPP
jgi:uncharacterized protein YgiM (DUF1202 family)